MKLRINSPSVVVVIVALLVDIRHSGGGFRGRL